MAKKFKTIKFLKESNKSHSIKIKNFSSEKCWEKQATE
jgi:hypothetical protein